MSSDTIEQRFEQLEEKLAYQEMATAELSEEIFRQQKEIDVLTLSPPVDGAATGSTAGCGCRG